MPAPMRPIHVLIEDQRLVDADVAAAPFPGVEVTTCAGPRRAGEVCPLVLRGSCPFGPVDVVVTALDGAWAPSVRAAWAEAAVPVVDVGSLAGDEPAARLTHCVGAALQELWQTATASR